MNRTAAAALPVVLTIFALSGGSGSALAQSPTAESSGLEPAAVVMEVYIRGQEGGKAPEYRALLAKELLKYGKYALMERDDATQRLTSEMLTPTKRITNDRLQDIERMVSRGDKLLYTDPREAVEILHQAKSELMNIMETISLNAQIRDELFKTQMLLARSHLDNGNEKRVRDVLKEVILEFGDDIPVTEENYHPGLVRLFRETKQGMASQRTATLRVESDPPGAEVFLNSQPQKATTPFTYEGLFPGTYHVQVRKDQMEGMVHKVVLEPNATASVTVDVGYESAMSFNKESFGLQFDTVADMDGRIAEYGARLGEFLQLDYVVLVGIVDRGAGPNLATYLVDVRNKQVVKSRELVVKPAVISIKRVEQMAAFLSGAEEIADTPGELTPTEGGAVWYENYAGWALTGVGVAGVVVGAIFTASYFDKKDQVESAQPTPSFGLSQAQGLQSDGETAGLIGAIGLGVGGAALATGVVLFVVDATSGPAPETRATPVVSGAPVPLPGGGGFSLGVTF